LPANIRLRVEVTDGDKHSSLLRCEINYGRKKFYETGPKNFDARNEEELWFPHRNCISGGATTLSITALSITALSITTFRIKILSTMTLSITINNCDTQFNDTKQ
jgi:hypothetical protein